MWAAIASAWALLVGIGLLMVGNGLQGSLLGLRASLEGFTTTTTGVLMSTYFAGYLAGSTVVPRVVARVGHIRVFAALASVASAAALLHAVFVEPFFWAAVRFVTGLCIAGLYVVAESWLNDLATNRTRGQLLSVYMVLVVGGMASGQFLLNLADPGGATLFMLVSVLVSVALVPIALTVKPAPAIPAVRHFGLGTLYASSPLAFVGCLAVGLVNAALIGLGVVYAGALGLSVREISLFMAAALIGGMAFQWPIGSLSDRFDRRRVLTAVTLAASVVAAASALSTGAALLALVFVYGGLSFPLYALCIAHANDHLEPAEKVAASGTLVLVASFGAALGPLAASAAMALLGPAGFFWWLALVHVGLGAFALYRMTVRPAVPLDEQGACPPMPPRASPATVHLALGRVRDQMDSDLARMSSGRGKGR